VVLASSDLDAKLLPMAHRGGTRFCACQVDWNVALLDDMFPLSLFRPEGMGNCYLISAGELLGKDGDLVTSSWACFSLSTQPLRGVWVIADSASDVCM
jgi:hypothetical protein